MAVSDFNAPNLAPSYGNVLDQLRTKADINLKTPSPLDAVTQTVRGIDAQLEQQEKERFEVGKMYLQNQFATEMEKMRQEHEKRGEVIIDDEMVADANATFGIDISKWKGLSVNPDTLSKTLEQRYTFMEDKGNKEKIEQIMNRRDLTVQQKAEMISALAPDTKKVAEEAAERTFEKPKQNKALRYADSTSSTGFRYAQTSDGEGRVIQSPDDLEAPPEKASNANAKTEQARANMMQYASRMKQALDQTSTGMKGKAEAITGRVKGAVGISGDKAQTSAQYYEDNRPAFAVGAYRMITGDTRLSDADARARALPIVPPLTDSPSVRAAKWAAIEEAIKMTPPGAGKEDGSGDPAAFDVFKANYESVLEKKRETYAKALKWLKEHPNDPKAVEVKKKLGMAE